jgi:hypothetical protein
LAVPLGAAPADTLTETLGDPGFDGAYRSYFDALAGYRPEDLRLELTETVEDALTGGSHLSRPKIDYKRRQIETALLRQARRDLCGSAPGAGSGPGSGQVKTACASAALAAAAEAGADLARDSLGAIAAVCARMAEGPARADWCRAP